jgi:hypothetical protein
MSFASDYGKCSTHVVVQELHELTGSIPHQVVSEDPSRILRRHLGHGSGVEKCIGGRNVER